MKDQDQNDSQEIGPAGEKLQKVLARIGVGSRRDVEAWITQKRIKVNGVEATLGQKQGSRLNKVLGEAPAEVFAMIERLGIDCQAQHKGTLHMAHNATGIADLEARHEQWRRRGADVELLTGAQCQEYCGTEGLAGQDAVVNLQQRQRQCQCQKVDNQRDRYQLRSPWVRAFAHGGIHRLHS